MSHELDDLPEMTVTLVERARMGDRAAFDALSARHQGRVFAICLKWTGNASDAEDLTQETLLKAYRHCAQMHDSARFAAWLARIAVNTCKNWLARERQETLPMETAQQEERRQSAPSEVEEQIAVREALEALPPTLRLAIELFYLHGLTQRELAGLWSLPESTIKGRLDAGRLRLRKELERMGWPLDTHADEEELSVPNTNVVLAASDRKEAREISAALQAEGFRCTVIRSGQPVLARLRRLLPGILILDVPFDDLDEYEILRALKIDPRTRDLLVIMLTAKAQDADVFRGWQSGVDCYLTKPFVMAELRTFVTRLGDRIKAGDYLALAIEYAWRRETPKALRCLAKAVELGGKAALETAKEDPAFNYLRHTNEFKMAVGDLPGLSTEDTGKGV